MEQNGYFSEPTPSWLNKKHNFIMFWFNLYTLAVWALMVAEFFSNGKIQLVNAFIGMYIPFLTAYTGHKELVRWRLNRHQNRIIGEIWVSVWLATGLILPTIKGIFPSIYKEVSLENLATIVGATILYFTATEYSKFEYKKRKPPLS